MITLCGSTGFEAEFAEVSQRLTMEGCVVISLGMFRLPDLPGGVDVSGLYELADALVDQGVRL